MSAVPVVTADTATRMRMLLWSVQLRIYTDQTLSQATRDRLIADMAAEFAMIDELAGVVR